jgi:hypothetical protein
MILTVQRLELAQSELDCYTISGKNDSDMVDDSAISVGKYTLEACDEPSTIMPSQWQYTSFSGTWDLLIRV